MGFWVLLLCFNGVTAETIPLEKLEKEGRGGLLLEKNSRKKEKTTVTPTGFKCKKQKIIAERTNQMLTPEGVESFNTSRLHYISSISQYKGLLDTWYDKSCTRWDLGGKWNEEKQRKIFVGFLFNDEFEILDVVLHELYPVVDKILLFEFDQTFFMEPKPLNFEAHKETYARWSKKLIHVPIRVDIESNSTLSKLYTIMQWQKHKKDPSPELKKRYEEHGSQALLSMAVKMRKDYDDTPNGRVFYAVRNYSKTDTHFQVRWESQMEQRKYVSDKALELGIGDDDIFVYSDVDELLSREFVTALTHCDEPIPEIAGKLDQCGKRSVKTFGHVYNFNRTAFVKEQVSMGFHPDFTLGRCLKNKNGLYGWTAHDVREASVKDFQQKRPKELSWDKLFGPKFEHHKKTEATKLEEARILAAIDPATKIVPESIKWLANSSDLIGWEMRQWIGTPAGWHMYSFATVRDLVDEQSMRAGAHLDEAHSEYYGCTAADVEAIIALDKEGVGEVASSESLATYFKMPHAIEDYPEKFPYFLKYVPDDQWPQWGSPTTAMPPLRDVELDYLKDFSV